MKASEADHRPRREMSFLEEAFRATHSGGPFPFLALLLGLVLVIGKMFPRGFAWVAILSAVLGFSLFSVAEFSLFSRGHWITFGSCQMTSRNRFLYRAGYGRNGTDKTEARTRNYNDGPSTDFRLILG